MSGFGVSDAETDMNLLLIFVLMYPSIHGFSPPSVTSRVIRPDLHPGKPHTVLHAVAS